MRACLPPPNRTKTARRVLSPIRSRCWRRPAQRARRPRGGKHFAPDSSSTTVRPPSQAALSSTRTAGSESSESSPLLSAARMLQRALAEPFVSVVYLRDAGTVVAQPCRSVLGSWGKTMRDAVRNKERWKGRRTPTQHPSTNKRQALPARPWQPQRTFAPWCQCWRRSSSQRPGPVRLSAMRNPAHRRGLSWRCRCRRRRRRRRRWKAASLRPG